MGRLTLPVGIIPGDAIRHLLRSNGHRLQFAPCKTATIEIPIQTARRLDDTTVVADAWLAPGPGAARGGLADVSFGAIRSDRHVGLKRGGSAY